MKIVTILTAALLVGFPLFALEFSVVSAKEISEPEQQLYSLFRNSNSAFSSSADPLRCPFRTRFALRSMGIADNKLAMWDLRSGRELWRRYLDGAPLQVRQADSTVVALTEGTLTAFGLTDGHVQWQYDVQAARYVDAARLGSRFVLYRDEAGTGGSRPQLARPAFAPAGNGDNLFLIGGDGRLLVLKPAEQGVDELQSPWTSAGSERGSRPRLVELRNGALLYLPSTGIAYRLEEDGTAAWSFAFPPHDQLLTASHSGGRYYLLGMKHSYCLSSSGRLVAESTSLKSNLLLVSEHKVWPDLVLIPDETRGLLAFDRNLEGPKWVFRPPHMVGVRLGLFKIGEVAQWQGAAVRLTHDSTDVILVQQHGSLYALDPHNGMVLSQTRLRRIGKPGGFTFAAPLLTPDAPAYVDSEKRVLFTVVGSLSGTLVASLDKQNERDFLVEVKW